MKSFFLTITFVIVVVLAAVAQTTAETTLANYEQKAQQVTTDMIARLVLTATQTDSVSLINKDYYHRVALLGGQQLTSNQRGIQLQTIDSLHNERLKNNLSLYQFNQLQQLKQQRLQKMDSLRATHGNHNH